MRLRFAAGQYRTDAQPGCRGRRLRARHRLLRLPDPGRGLRCRVVRREGAGREHQACVFEVVAGRQARYRGCTAGADVNAEIARVRNVPEGRAVPSPPCHRAFSTPRELVRFIARMRELSGAVRTGFKLSLGSRSWLIARPEEGGSAAAQNHDDSDDDDDNDDGTQAYVHEFPFPLGERHPSMPQKAECPHRFISARAGESVAPL